MKLKQIIIFTLATASILFSSLTLLTPSTVSAACADPYPVSVPTKSGRELCCPKSVPANDSDAQEQCMFLKYINPTIYMLSMIAGMAVVGGLIWGGIQYSKSAGDPQKVTKAKASIMKSLTALVIFLVFVPAVRFLTPGGLNPIPPSGGLVNAKTCVEANKFLGLKPWYAYLPDDSFESNCTIKKEVRLLPGPKDETGGQNPGVMPQVALAITDSLLRIAALVAVVFVIVGGVKYITSQGEPAQTKLALSSIINALIGLAVALVAALVVGYIGNALT